MSLDALPDEVSKHVPRAYQEELFSIARRQNVIAALDTGSGKTYIAAMLIKSICASPENEGKKVFFLVPKVPLVDQQRDFLEEQTPLRIRGYKGAMGVDNWDKTTWHKEIEGADVLVMTAQIFKNILTHAYWAVEDVSLLVFDECHHARNNHPFNTIMMDHYVQCDAAKRPKIFGMTASPVWNERQPVASIQKLQSNLFAQVYAVKEHTNELGKHAPKPKEIILHFESPPALYSEYPAPLLWADLEKDGLLSSIGLRAESLEARYRVTLDTLGPAAAEHYLCEVLSAKLEKEIRSEHDELVRRLKRPKHVHRENEMDKTDSANNAQDGFPLEAAQQVLRSLLHSIRTRLELDAFPLAWMAPKYSALVNLLANHKSGSFRGILFVEQRQVAVALTWLMARTAETKDWIKCAELMGHGDIKDSGDGISGMGLKPQDNVVKAFRNGDLNLIVATSVAEEGLDFPACDLVIRFDPVRNMVAYVQSRGRARQQASTFVVMIDKTDELELARYMKMRDAEPELKKTYQLDIIGDPTVEQDEDDDRVDPQDLNEREVYVVEATGATLTFSSAIALLSRLCSLIPRDRYSTPFKPKYAISSSELEGGYRVRLTLPTALPLPKHLQELDGPIKRSKKEAKRAVAFLAVRALHELGVYDDQLSPSKRRKGEGVEDADGLPIPKVVEVPEHMEVLVKSPWRAGPPWYLHAVHIDGVRCAGLITGDYLMECSLRAHDMKVETASPVPLHLDNEKTLVMDRFTRMGIWWCVSGRPISERMACYLVPLDSNGQPDWASMHAAVANEQGSYDWSHISSEHEGKLVLMNGRKYGQSLLLRGFRPDISLSDKRVALDRANGDILVEDETYAEYFARTYSYAGNANSSHAPMDSPIIEVTPFRKVSTPIYTLRDGEQLSGGTKAKYHEFASFLLPQWYCKHVPFSEQIVRSFRIFSPLCQRLTDLYRAHQAIEQLHLPAINPNRMVEALVIPSAMAGFNNQRLETLGDSVLKLCVVTYLYNRFPFKHEGQLDQLKATSVSNRCLLSRGKIRGLEQYISSESRPTKGWHFTLEASKDDGTFHPPNVVRSIIPRRSMQDCMEATLGAAYLTGGIDMALDAGSALGLCFGGKQPWMSRYALQKEASCPGLFAALQEKLQYKFRNGELLLEAVTHPSFNELGGSCYQRLEFLGDAVMDLVTTTHVFDSFPSANSGQLSWTRSHLICNATFASVAVKRFSLQKYLLVNNVELSKAIAEEIEVLESASFEDIVQNNWKYDPPKLLGDIFESVIGAVFVDSGFDFALTMKVAKLALGDALPHIRLDMPKDPISTLHVFVGKAGCRKTRFQKVQSNPEVARNDSSIVLVHDKVVAGPFLASTMALAKATAAVEALGVLQDESSKHALRKLCTCMSVDEDELSRPQERREKDFSNETEDGFAVLSDFRADEATREEQAEAEPIVALEDDETSDLKDIAMVERMLNPAS